MTLANFREITKGLDGKKVKLRIRTDNGDGEVEEYGVSEIVISTRYRDVINKELQETDIIFPIDIDC